MGILGAGKANGACSLLHAAGLGYGASLALELPLAVRLLDTPWKEEPEDPDNLLGAVLDAWRGAGHPLPGEELHWAVISKIPPKQGLKSSSALCVAAFRALMEATDVTIDNAEIVNLSAVAQINANVSLTGSFDDTWACIEGGWKLIDINAEDPQSGVLLESPGPDTNEWDVTIMVPEPRLNPLSLEDFVPHQEDFIQSLNAIQEGNEMVAMTWNGRAMLGVTKKMSLRRVVNDAYMNGARAASISGSGNAVVIFTTSISPQTKQRVRTMLERIPNSEIIETKVIN